MERRLGRIGPTPLRPARGTGAQHVIERDDMREAKVLRAARPVRDYLRVVADLVTDEVNTRVSLHVNGEMYATPIDIPVEFVADVETYSGKVKVKQS